MAKLEYNFNNEQLRLIESAGDTQAANQFDPISIDNGGPGHFVKMSVFNEDGTFVRSFYSNIDLNGIKVLYGSPIPPPTSYNNPTGPEGGYGAGLPIYAGIGTPQDPAIDELGLASATNFCLFQGETHATNIDVSPLPALYGYTSYTYHDGSKFQEHDTATVSVWTRIDCQPPALDVDWAIVGTPELNLYRTKTDDNVNFYFKPNETLSRSNLPGGNYQLKFEFLRGSLSVLGQGIVNPRYTIKEISPSRKEVRISPAYDGAIPFTFSAEDSPEQLNFQDRFRQLIESSGEPTGTYKFDYLLGISQGRSIPITNYLFDNRTDVPSLIIKLNASIPVDVFTLEEVTIDQQIFTTHIENIIYKGEGYKEPLSGAGLDAQQFGGLGSAEFNDQEQDPFQSFADLTGSLTDTSVESWIISGSGFGVDVNLNVDYNDFTNHVFFGSATSKLDNFKTKLSNIETQQSRISSSLSGTGIAMSGDTKAKVDLRKNSFKEIQRIRDTFTPYERFLYYDYQGETTASAPGIGQNLAASIPVTGSFDILHLADGFPTVYKHSSVGSSRVTYPGINYFRGKYKAEEKPFFNYSGSLYLSFLLKGHTDISSFQLENLNPLYNEFEKDKLPKTALGSGSVLVESVANDSWRRFIFEASQSYWRPKESQRYNMINWNGLDWEDETKYQILSHSEQINSASNSPTSSVDAYAIQAFGPFYKSIGTVFLTGSLSIFTGSFMPSGEVFRLSASLGASGIKHSYMTDVKITKRNPIDVYPFSNMYKTTSTTFDTWFTSLRDSASAHDENNIHSLMNNLPKSVREHTDGKVIKDFVNLIGENFDLLRNYIDNFTKIHERDYNKIDGVPPNLLPILGKNLGWDFIQPFTGSMSEYFGTSQDDIRVGGRSVEEITHNTWRKVLNNLMYVYKTKGTVAGSTALLNTYGYPSDTLGVQEFGGSTQEHNPAIITDDISKLLQGVKGTTGNVSLVESKEEFFSYILNSDPSRTLNLDWYTNSANNLETLEFVIKPYRSINNQILFESTGSASESLWDLRLLPSGSDETLGQLQFRLNNSLTGSKVIADNAVSMSTSYLPFKTSEDFWNVMLLRLSSSISGSGTQGYKLVAGLQNEDRIVNFEAVSMSVSGGTSVDSNHRANQNWFSTGSLSSAVSGNLSVGRTYTGSIAEIRAWTTQLSASKFKQHTLNKRSIVGNNITASNDEIVYRFPLQENLTSGSIPLIKDANPKNVKDYSFAIQNQTLTGSVLYDRDIISIAKFSIRAGGTDQPDSNKILIDPEESIVTNLNPNQSSVRPLYDKSIENKRTRSSKMQIVRSPQTVLNDFIINTLADYDVSDKFGDPADIYKNEYSDLDEFRNDLFDHYDIDIDINKWIDAQARIFNPDMVDSLKSNLPVRGTVDNVGVVFEPTLLERNKFKNPTSTIESGSFELFDADWDVANSYTLSNTGISEQRTNQEYPVDENISFQESDAKGSRDGEHNPTKNIDQTWLSDQTKEAVMDINGDLLKVGSFESSRNGEYSVPDNISTATSLISAPHMAHIREFNTSSLKSFENSHDSWGTSSNDLHFVNMAATTADGFSNVNHDEKRYAFMSVGDVEILGSTEKSLVTAQKLLINNFRSPGTVNVNIDFNNIVNFQNREMRDKTNPKYIYKSYVSGSGDLEGIQKGRPVGKTSYFSTSSAGIINYPANHWIRFSEDGMRSNFISGHQNVGGSFLELEEKEDLSTASFYSVDVTGENQLVVRRGKRESKGGTLETR